VKRGWVALLLLALPVAWCGQGHAGVACAGDCNGDQRVTIDEVLTGVNIALGSIDLGACAVLDLDMNQRIDVNELVAAVGSLIDDCGRNPMPTRVPDDVCAGVPTIPGTALRTELIARGLSRPLYVTAPRLDTHRLFIVEQTGRVRVVKDGVLLNQPFLDLSAAVSCCGERGLLGLAFHPGFAANGRVFVNYTNRGGSTVIARYQVSDVPDVADPASAQTLLTIAQPFSNHNGGQLAFGPDGYMYVGMGDGGSGGDPREAGQSDTTLLGKLLRIDVDVEEPPFYAVPATNPNPGAGDPLGLVWAKGLRNPWRFSFDRLRRDLYIADVGQNRIEEINVQPSGSEGGENYGWDVFEGSDCFDPEPLFRDCPDPADGFVMPVLEYTHAEGCSVTGGFVYRGCALPDLHGTYFYADYCSGFVRSFIYADGLATQHRDWSEDLAAGAGQSLGSISSFGEDARGEIYICDLTGGRVFKIVAGD
jgi:glucose/arabinose dehydrogenase